MRGFLFVSEVLWRPECEQFHNRQPIFQIPVDLVSSWRRRFRRRNEWPDRLVFDLNPVIDVTFAPVSESARDIRERIAGPRPVRCVLVSSKVLRPYHHNIGNGYDSELPTDY